jgi:hypothetical protein
MAPEDRLVVNYWAKDGMTDEQQLRADQHHHANDIAGAFTAGRPADDWWVSGFVILPGLIGEPEIVELTIEPNPQIHPKTPPAGGITPDVTRSVKVGEITAAVSALVYGSGTSTLALPRELPPGLAPHEQRLWGFAADYLTIQATGGRGILGELASLWAQREGAPEPLPIATVRDRISRATRAHFLASGHRGRAGRLPGDKFHPTPRTKDK